MILICVGDDGDVHTFKDVLGYDCFLKEDVIQTLEDRDVEVTNEQLKKICDEVQNRIARCEYFPNISDIRDYVGDILYELGIQKE